MVGQSLWKVHDCVVVSQTPVVVLHFSPVGQVSVEQLTHAPLLQVPFGAAQSALEGQGLSLQSPVEMSQTLLEGHEN